MGSYRKVSILLSGGWGRDFFFGFFVVWIFRVCWCGWFSRWGVPRVLLYTLLVLDFDCLVNYRFPIM